MGQNKIATPKCVVGQNLITTHKMVATITGDRRSKMTANLKPIWTTKQVVGYAGIAGLK